jgi:hypothetical protein
MIEKVIENLIEKIIENLIVSKKNWSFYIFFCGLVVKKHDLFWEIASASKQ